MSKRFVKRMVFNLLTVPFVNRVALMVVRGLGISGRVFVPFRGKVAVPSTGFYLFSSGDDSIAAKIAVSPRLFEPDVSRAMVRIMPHVDSFFDIGANTGYYSLLAASAPSIRSIYAFEPFARAYSSLVANIERNGITNVKYANIAIGGFCGCTTLYVPPDLTIPTGSSTMSGGTNGRVNYLEQACLVETLDSFVDRNNITSVGLLKIDTEGTEVDVLGGGAGTIQKHRPFVCVEISDLKSLRRVREIMCDYSVYLLKPVGVVKCSSDMPSVRFDNFLLVPGEKAGEDFVRALTTV